MKLTTVNGYYNGDEIQIELPAHETVKEALFNPDYSQGIIQNQDAAHLLAKQFCLSKKQKNVTQKNGVNIWLSRVNGAIQGLAAIRKIVRTKDATIITVDALKNLVVDFLGKLGYESVEVVTYPHFYIFLFYSCVCSVYVRESLPLRGEKV